MGKLTTLIAPVVAAIGLASPASAAPVNAYTPPQISEFVAAVQSVADEYDLPPITIVVEHLPYGAYAGSYSFGKMVYSDILAGTPGLAEQWFASDLAEGYHSPGCSVQTYIGYHESGHFIDYKHHRDAELVALQWAETTSESPTELSGYSFEGGVFDPPEALAEAFAAVKCDPAGSTPAEYALYNILINTQ